MTARSVLASVALGVVVLAGCSSASTSSPPASVSLPGGSPTALPSTQAVVNHGLITQSTSAARTGSASRSSTSPVAGTAAALLATLTTKPLAPITGYSRTEFGPAWTDDNDDPLGHNGCDTRNDVLKRDLTVLTFRSGTSDCVVLTGHLTDPYTGRSISFTRGVKTSDAIQIDHVVALGDAWQTGAAQLSDEQRRDLANDPLELLAVDGPTNESKGDDDASMWLPPSAGFRCSYVARQIAVKAKYKLWVTPTERQAMSAVLTTCRTQLAPTEH